MFSSVIKASRFPLIALVVLIHTIGLERIDLSNPSFDRQFIYDFLTGMISHNYAFIAVCMFFLFSGYLFFYGTENFTWKWCVEKWKKRFFSIFLPFVAWNLIFILAVAVQSVLSRHFNISKPDDDRLLSWKQIGYWFSAPVNYPLWFLRDLIKMILLAPAVWFVCRKARTAGLAALSLLYLSTWSPSLIDMRALFYFFAGAYLAIWKTDVMKLVVRFGTASHIGTVILLAAATYFNASEYHETLLLRLFFPFGIVSFLNIMNALPGKLRNWSSSMADTSFFIFATHTIFVINLARGFCFRLFNEDYVFMPMSYICIPVITISVCVLIYRIMSGICPRITGILCGGRISR